MKILAIRGKNLASLEGEFEIDFAKEPLKSVGIFAITGSTGAGKSTILDAMCLALFDDAPRLSKAEASVKVYDTGDKTITQKDSRNILRRGASDGYAEIDFIALNGNRYSSQWLVRRARGKASGSLQNTEIRLQNLSTGSEEQGTKTELLNRIVELIGLNFDQFTRAVLLAQGDFATFLKAKQNEKAELLEKLTGTEIYSHISSRIYEKKKEAEKNLDLIRQRIKDVKLLTEEEISQLNLEKDDLEKNINPLKKSLPVIDKKLNWIKQEETLKGDISQVTSELKTVQQTIENAGSRYKYLRDIDTSQEIRDTYIDLNNRKKQVESLQLNLTSKETELKTIVDALEKSKSDVSIAKKVVDDHEQKQMTFAPEIKQARDFDVKIQAVKEKVGDTQKEFDLYKKQEDQTRENITLLTKNYQESKNLAQTLTVWFDEKKVYQDIIPKVDLIVTLLNNAQTAKSQKENVLASLKSSQQVLKTNEENLAQQEKEVERLNQLLPTEILNLRDQLEDGKPCLVCGSVHHPFHNELFQKDNVNEKELEAAKKKVAQSVSDIKDNIDKIKKGVTEFETHILSFQSQYDKAIVDVKEHVQDKIEDWEELFESKILQQDLLHLANQWNKNRDLLTSHTQQLEAIMIKLDSENKALNKLQEEVSKRGDILQKNSLSLKEYIEVRGKLLGGKSVEEIEKWFSTRKDEYAKSYEQIRLQKDKLDKDKAKIDGILSQLKIDIKLNDDILTKLNKDVINWVSNGNHSISMEMLPDLMSKSRDWIAQEKEVLAKIKEQELTFSATLKERNMRLHKHSESEDRPAKNENKEMLVQQLDQTNIKLDEMSKRLTEILVSFKTHETAREQIKSFEKELLTKQELFNNWAKLDDLLGSAQGTKFKTIAQGYTLDVLLGYANRHLEQLTKRYQLEKIEDSLALQVIDNDTLGEVRSVHTLSGGESFLISLALALGLSSLSSNRMKIESLFIDEGFGSLDIDTLSIAMDALENLQTQGRKIGVISHVAEMMERITTQVQVIKLANGRSKVQVVG